MTYAITFDIDTNYLNNSYDNAYYDIGKALKAHGFKKQQNNLYFGSNEKNAVDCILAVQELASQFDWVALCIKDIHMLRIEELNNLNPAIEKVMNLKKTDKKY